MNASLFGIKNCLLNYIFLLNSLILSNNKKDHRFILQKLYISCFIFPMYLKFHTSIEIYL